MEEKKRRQGFAALDPKKRSEIARLGGKAASSDREHMRKIGSRGGLAKRDYKATTTPEKKP